MLVLSTSYTSANIHGVDHIPVYYFFNYCHYFLFIYYLFLIYFSLFIYLLLLLFCLLVLSMSYVSANIQGVDNISIY